MRRAQFGFGVVEVVVAVVIVGMVSALGYVAYDRFIAQPAPAAETAQSEATVEIKSSTDLDKASKELDGISFDNEADNTALDAAAKAF